jgi:5-methylcytosine-specific restriction endonuclease McrA
MRKVSARREREDDEYLALRRRVLERDGRRCRAHRLGYAPEVPCAGPLEVDHFVPVGVWKGGRLVDDNCWAMCQRLNQAKNADPAWAVRIGIMSRTPGDPPPEVAP